MSYTGYAVKLRPALRAAVAVEHLHGGFPALFRTLSELHTATILTVIRVAAFNDTEAKVLSLALGDRPLRDLMPPAQGPFFSLCDAPIPQLTDSAIELETITTPQTSVSWPELFRQLFGFATGVLGWCPAEA